MAHEAYPPKTPVYTRFHVQPPYHNQAHQLFSLSTRVNYAK